jgi:hypothetical protein
MVARHDERAPFVPAGRIGVGRVVVSSTAGDPAAVQVTIPIRDPRGAIEACSGTAAELPAAVAAALRHLSTAAFTIEGLHVSAGRAADGVRAARVLVRAKDEATPRHAVGRATADDDASAIAAATVRGLAVAGLLRRRLVPPGARDVEASTDRIVQGIGRLLPAAQLPPEAVGDIRALVAHELHRFGEGQAIVAAHSPDPTSLLTRFDAQAALEEAAGERRSSDTRTANWWEWFPGLDNDARTLRDVLAGMPAAPPTAIPWIIRLFENDKGWLRLHGAVNLERHDMIHVLLGRGLLDQDEAFVIGFTMGCTKAVSRLEKWLFRFAVSRLYPEPYRIHAQTLAAYDLGLEAGRNFGIRNLHLRLRRDMLDRPLGDVRRELGIDTARLRRFYARERESLPGTLASLRLPVDG